VLFVLCIITTLMVGSAGGAENIPLQSQ